MREIPHYLGMLGRHCNRYDLDPAIIDALIQQESLGDPWAFRYEPGFYKRYLGHLSRSDLNGHVPKRLPTIESEKVARSTSFGLMQIMGETARGAGFDKDYLSELFDPEINIELGCKFFRSLLDKYTDEETDKDTAYRTALLRYNGGGDPSYPDKVLSRVYPPQKKGDS